MSPSRRRRYEKAEEELRVRLDHLEFRVQGLDFQLQEEWWYWRLMCGVPADAALGVVDPVGWGPEEELGEVNRGTFVCFAGGGPRVKLSG